MDRRRILFISKGVDRASTRYRALQYFGLLERAGWSPQHADAPSGLRECRAVFRAARAADVVVIVRRLFPWPVLMALRRAARRLVFDLDDAVFLNDDGTPSPGRQRRFAAAVRACDHAWAGNRYLADACRAHRPAVTIVPTSIDPAKYDVNPDKPDHAIDLVRIGSSATRKYLDDVMGSLDEAAGSVPQLRLKVIADFQPVAQRIDVRAVRWSADTEATELASSHIGLAPLRDDPWTRGKCGLKVLQYMAAGLPVIAADAGVHPEMIVPGQEGLLVRLPRDWVDGILALARDQQRREAMGRAGRDRVRAAYSIDAAAGTLLASLEALVSSE